MSKANKNVINFCLEALDPQTKNPISELNLFFQDTEDTEDTEVPERGVILSFFEFPNNIPKIKKDYPRDQ